MARQVEYSKQDLQQQAIAAAKKLVQSGGLSALSARRLATKLGCSVGTLYNAFGSLDALILQLNGETLDLLYNEIEAALKQSNRSLGEAIGASYMRFVSKQFPLWGLLFEHKLAPGRQLPDWYQTKINRLFGLLEEALKETMSASQARIAARVLWAGLHGISQLELSDKLRATGFDQAQELCIALFENYLRGVAQ